MWEQVHPDDRDKGSEIRLEELRAGRVHASEFRLRHAGGLWRHVAATPINLVETTGYVVSVLRDQTPLALARNVVRAAGKSKTHSPPWTTSRRSSRRSSRSTESE
jgi:hypothetical protein